MWYSDMLEFVYEPWKNSGIVCKSEAHGWHQKDGNEKFMIPVGCTEGAPVTRLFFKSKIIKISIYKKLIFLKLLFFEFLKPIW